MPEASARERFHAVMHFEPGVRSLNWEFAYWVAAIERWYGEGLRRTPYSPPPGLPPGDAIFGEGLPYPFRPGFLRYRDIDVHTVLGFEDGAVRLPLHWRHSPPFTETILEEDETTLRSFGSARGFVGQFRLLPAESCGIPGTVSSRVS